MTYSPQTWQNDATGQTPVSAPRLAYMEAGIVAAHNLPAAGAALQLYRVNVKDYGAKGDGTTDDSAAIVAARNAVTSTLVNGEASRELYFPAGNYIVKTPDALLNSPTTSPAAINGYWIEGDRKRGSQITFSSTVGASTDPLVGNLITAVNRVLRLRIKNIRFNSTNANQSFFYGFNSSTNTGGNLLPQYGFGHNNQDFILEDVEWTGSWKRGIGLDGDWNANLNSEWVFKNCHHANSTTWSDAFLHSGVTKATSSGSDPAGFNMTSGEGYYQQDQFLNFDFYSCKFEPASGDIIKMDKGGGVRVFGGSWIYIDNAAAGTFFKMAPESHVDSVMNLAVYGTRFELRSPNNKLLDTGWYGKRGHISFYNVSTSSQSFRSWAAEAEQISIRGRGNAMPHVKFDNCDLMGFAKVYSSTGVTGGRLVFDCCSFANWASGGAPATTGSFIRYPASGGVAPKYRYADCADITDASN